MKTNKNIFKIMTISIVTLFLFNCSDDIQEDNTLSEELNLQEDDLSTVPLESTLDFFNSLNTTNRLSRTSGDQNNIGLEIDIASLEQVDISDTDAKLNIANATTKFDNVETQILQIEIDGTLQTVLFHHIPEDTTDSNRYSARTAGYSFTGSVFTTSLSGTVMSGFRINLGKISGSFNFRTPIYNTDPDPCWGIGCGIALDEVVISSPSNYAAVNHTTMDNRSHQWNRSSNNYSSMGTAFANYYWQKKERERQKKIKDFEKEIDDKDLKNCMKSILNSLKNINNSVGDIIAKFAGNTPGFNWEVKDGPLSGGTGQTSISYNRSTGTATSTFDSQAWKDASDLSWARTILHESIHANIVASFGNDYFQAQQTFSDFFREFQDSRNPNYNDLQHAEIVRNYVGDIANSLKEYGVAKGYNLSDEFYNDLAWGGLQETDAFKSKPINEQERILNVSAIELTGKDLNGQSKTKKGKDAGCE